MAGDWDGNGLDDPAKLRTGTGDRSLTGRVQKGGSAENGRLGLSDDELAVAGDDLLYGKYLAVPKQVGLADIAEIGDGQTHSVAGKGDGTVWAWGYNTYEQLCGGTSTSLPDTVATPVRIDLGE